MTIVRPPLYSIWENDQGDRLVVPEVSQPFTDEEIARGLADEEISSPEEVACVTERMREFFIVTYEENGHKLGMDVDNEQWATFIAA